MGWTTICLIGMHMNEHCKQRGCALMTNKALETIVCTFVAQSSVYSKIWDSPHAWEWKDVIG